MKKDVKALMNLMNLMEEAMAIDVPETVANCEFKVAGQVPFAFEL